MIIPSPQNRTASSSSSSSSRRDRDNSPNAPRFFRERDDSTSEMVDVTNEPTPLPRLRLAVIGAVYTSEALQATFFLVYLPALVRDLGVTKKEELTGVYAGLLVSVFYFSRFLSSSVWGWLSDRYGRRPVLLAALTGGVAFSALYGIATSFSYPFTLLSLALLGAFTGFSGASRSYLGEITDGSNQARAFSFVALMYALGEVASPLISGSLSKPGAQRGYVLPALACAAVSLCTLGICACALTETDAWLHEVRYRGVEKEQVPFSVLTQPKPYHARKHSEPLPSSSPKATSFLTTTLPHSLQLPRQRQSGDGVSQRYDDDDDDDGRGKVDNDQLDNLDHAQVSQAQVEVNFDESIDRSYGDGSVYPFTGAQRSPQHRTTQPRTQRLSSGSGKKNSSHTGSSPSASANSSPSQAPQLPPSLPSMQPIGSPRGVQPTVQPLPESQVSSVQAIRPHPLSTSTYSNSFDPDNKQNKQLLKQHLARIATPASVSSSFTSSSSLTRKPSFEPLLLPPKRRRCRCKCLTLPDFLLDHAVWTTITTLAFIYMAEAMYEFTLLIIGQTSIPEGGLGFKPSTVGLLLSLHAFGSVLVQLLIYPKLAKCVGLRRLVMVTLVIMVPIFLFFPALNEFTPFVTGGDWAILIAVIALKVLVVSSGMVSATLLVNNSAPPRHAGLVNGVGASASSLAQASGPLLAGLIWSWSEDLKGFAFHAYICYAFIAFFTIIAALISFFIPVSASRPYREQKADRNNLVKFEKQPWDDDGVSFSRSMLYRQVLNIKPHYHAHPRSQAASYGSRGSPRASQERTWNQNNYQSTAQF